MINPKTEEIGQLEEFPIRRCWRDEEDDFTPWLADNIGYLGDEDLLGIPLEVEATEANVGRFFADIHAKDIFSERDVVIENQYGSSDHQHLGKLMVYAAGLNAEVVVWIAEEFRDEHIDAIQWLNNRAEDKSDIFAISIKLVRIGDSAFAPMFNMVEKPSRWKETLQRMDSTEDGGQKERFWNTFEATLSERGFDSLHGSRQIGPEFAYYPISKGITKIRLAAAPNRNRLYCELLVDDESGEFGGLDREAVTTWMYNSKKELDIDMISDEDISGINWDAPKGQKRNKITIEYPNQFEFDDEDQWSVYLEWLSSMARLYEKVFYRNTELQISSLGS